MKKNKVRLYANEMKKWIRTYNEMVVYDDWVLVVFEMWYVEVSEAEYGESSWWKFVEFCESSEFSFLWYWDEIDNFKLVDSSKGVLIDNIYINQ